jgi:hypothetical protein
MHGLFSTSTAITKLSLKLKQHFSDGESNLKNDWTWRSYQCPTIAGATQYPLAH